MQKSDVKLVLTEEQAEWVARDWLSRQDCPELDTLLFDQVCIEDKEDFPLLSQHFNTS